MRHLRYIPILAVLLAVPAYSQITDASQAPRTDEAEQISKLMSEIEQAFVSRDPAPFERIYLDGYVGVRGRPIYNAFEQLIAMIRWDAAAIKAGKKLDFETISFENENPTVRIVGDAAIVTGTKRNVWRYRDARCTFRYQSTDVFAKIAGRWRLALGHMTPIPCDPMPWQPPHPAIAELKNQAKPTRNLSPAVETDIRELLSKLHDPASSADPFAAEFTFTAVNNDITTDRAALTAALKTQTSRSIEKYRGDEAYLSFGGGVAAYLFRVRSLPKGIDTKPEPPVTFSVIFAKIDGTWRIVSGHASALGD